MPKYLFTAKSLQDLMSRSKALRLLNQQILTKINREIQDIDSPKTQALYRILIEERDKYSKIEKDYLEKSNQIISAFQIQVTEKYTKKLRDQLNISERKAKKAEEDIANKLLESLN